MLLPAERPRKLLAGSWIIATKSTWSSTMSVFRPYFGKIRTPQAGDKVYKDECAFSFDNPESETGLYVCMNTFLGFGKKHVERYFKKTGNRVFLHLKRTRKEVVTEDAPTESKVTKLAIGVEGGFQTDEKKIKFEEHNSVVVLPGWETFSLPNQDLPEIVQMSVRGLLAAEDAWKMAEAAAMAGTWDGEKRLVSKHAENLLQLDNSVKVPPTGWKCEKCELTTNLWLNLTDGSILCGRKFFDGTGGNNHGVEHYQTTRYPLAVKLGTITPDGADVYSYEEDDMVDDPFLAKHLAHFGINITSMQKTEKTMIELEIDLNQKVGEWDVIQEAGSKLTPMYGPGYTGLRNLGNSCYMNSVMQVVFTIPDFQQRYVTPVDEIFDNAPFDPTSDFTVQIAKLGHGLLSGDYSKPHEGGDENVQAPPGIRPQMFKTLIGRGHHEFSTKRQQDAQEFFLHLLSELERYNRGRFNPSDCFKFRVEERVECSVSKKVKYTERYDFLLPLPVPMEAATNKEAVLAWEAKKKEMESLKRTIDPKDIVRPHIPMQSCLEMFGATEVVEGFYSSAINGHCAANKQTRLLSFPDYLVVQLKKFTVGNDWVPKKLDISLDVLQDLDLTPLRGHGMQPGEENLPESMPANTSVSLDEVMVSQLVETGFPVEVCKKAVFNSGNNGLEAAMNYIMEHMDDPDFMGTPFVPPGSERSEFKANEEAVAMVMSMGFTAAQATKALKNTDNNLERAVEWIFSHADELDKPMETEDQSAAPAQPQCRDGNGKYKLVAFISHMGASTMVGHYVCHILKEGRWVIFNDEKVALSEHPPMDLAYLYLYRRV
ncbi:ubiquitin carboxyl-terminal hydrolase 5-like isoform X2 [Dreissena polymorpha]|uniref:ubiquitin carboxyl-terminal hydrolase 5-like isoform X2 n=1 Tax=Dreissena polymorpha TaxID=45954 RepID=UPI0022642F72|nr:ubiquitin carboxyl-terminal hydrolase 5-like isoform X2 [Dreissena polymorpha]